ncbi:hypothetical protein [Prosthecomicrobium sp. N25]|uniref:hypothetical protein n=1 Tax=Prosthecomicrobium sp. N25 TaxID=3129254 RepID=UPI0030789485
MTQSQTFLAAVALAAFWAGSAAAETGPKPPEAPVAGPTRSGGPALAPEADRTNANSAVGGTGELPNSGSTSGGEDPAGSPTNCLAGDTRPRCAGKTQP